MRGTLITELVADDWDEPTRRVSNRWKKAAHSPEAITCKA